MAVSLKQSVEAERAAQAKAENPVVPMPLAGAALAHEIASAIRAARGAGILTDSERDALAQMIAERVTRKNLRERVGRPVDVLRFIDRAERLPLWAEQAEQVQRGTVGRDYLRTLAERLLRESREWRDLAQTYSVRERAQRERSGPTVALESWEAYSASADGRSLLDEALARDWNRRPQTDRAPLPEASAELCEQWAESLAILTDAQRRYARYALLSDLAGIAGDVLARREGRTLRAAIADANRGRSILRTLYPTSRELVAAGRRIADACGLLERDPQNDRPTLTDAQAQALATVDGMKRSERQLVPMRSRMAGPQAGSARDVLAWIATAEALAALERKPTPEALYLPHARHLRAARRPLGVADASDPEKVEAARRTAERAAQRQARDTAEARANADAVRAAVTAAGDCR